MAIVDGFMGANIATKIVFFLILLAVVVNWIAFCTTSWYVGEEYIGLWRTCRNKSCSVMNDGNPDDDINAVQAFAIFGFMALNVGFLLINLYMFSSSCKGNIEAGIGAAITLFLSAACWLIAVAIFGAKQDDLPGRFGYSYALAVCALILALIGGFFMLIGGRGNIGVSLK
ncbi:epithelial membrane protein 1 [Biomphalaria glabrata]|uniref:Epithelial membrane protein 1-like n=1 Tax=Biomphalaria glabrata TaxID=6526 RepID=A0A9W2ZT79_BIOGL|nr:epithelial membrane protein 1-like [Biomphalaria glabrata]XP_055878083.1 epithelial membrane protein 1-like [Biomphalaria glabrata]